MPRLSNSLLRHANRIDRLLPLLLQSCRDLNSACNELRWLREHVNVRNAPSLSGLCRQRATGKPLQYILGSQSFGELDILCEPGVLIPRYTGSIYPSWGQSADHLGLKPRATRPILQHEFLGRMEIIRAVMRFVSLTCVAGRDVSHSCYTPCSSSTFLSFR